MTKEQFIENFEQVLDLNNKNWMLLSNYSIVNYNPANLHTTYIQVSKKLEIDKDFLYCILSGDVYELDLSFLRVQLNDINNYSIYEFEEVTKGKLNAVKIPFKYLTKCDIENLNIKRSNSITNENMNIKKIVNNVNVTNTVNNEEIIKINRLLDKKDFEEELESSLNVVRKLLIENTNKFNSDNWDTLLKKIALRKQRSVLAICDSLLDKDLQRYYNLLESLEITNIPRDLKENKLLENDVEDIFNSIIQFFILNKFQILKKIRNSI